MTDDEVKMKKTLLATLTLASVCVDVARDVLKAEVTLTDTEHDSLAAAVAAVVDEFHQILEV